MVALVGYHCRISYLWESLGIPQFGTTTSSHVRGHLPWHSSSPACALCLAAHAINTKHLLQGGGAGVLKQEGLKGLQADGGMLVLAQFALKYSKGCCPDLLMLSFNDSTLRKSICISKGESLHFTVIDTVYSFILVDLILKSESQA